MENGNNSGTALAERLPQPAQVQRREIRVVEDTGILANLMDTARFEHLQRIASLMASSSLLPLHLSEKKGTPYPFETVRANCFRIVNQALRWGIDPFAMVDETYVVSGKLGYQGKLVAAIVNTRANLKSRLSYKFEGVGDNRIVTVIGTFDGEDETRESTLRLGDAKTDNGMWRKDPDQKLIYSAVVKWARRYCPEVILGVLTDDDIDRMQAQTPPTPISSTTLAQQFNEQDIPTGAAPAFPAPTGTPATDPLGQPVTVVPPADEAEANRIIEEAAARTRAEQGDTQLEPGEVAATTTTQVDEFQEWKDSVFDAMRGRGITPPQMAKAWMNVLVGNGVKGKERELPPAKYGDILKAASEGVGFFAKP